MKLRGIIVGILLSCIPLASFAASCTVTEYASVATDDNGRPIPIPLEPSITVQTVSYTSSTQSSAFNNSTHFIRIYCAAAAYYVVGTNPTATAASTPIIANIYIDVGIKSPASSYKIAIYDGSS